MLVAIIVIVIIQAVVCGMFCKNAAKEKGKDPDTWLMLGFMFGIIALIALVASPSTPRAKTSYTNIDEQRKCPFCAEWVKIEAVVCRFCNRDLPVYVIPTATFTSESEITIPHPNVCRKCGLQYKEDIIVCPDCDLELEIG